jgi:hypothetical protein
MRIGNIGVAYHRAAVVAHDVVHDAFIQIWQGAYLRSVARQRARLILRGSQSRASVIRQSDANAGGRHGDQSPPKSTTIRWKNDAAGCHCLGALFGSSTRGGYRRRMVDGSHQQIGAPEDAARHAKPTSARW